MQRESDPDAKAAIDALVTLNTRINDALAGFETMLEHSEPEFHNTVSSFVDLHRRHATEVAGLLARNGTADSDPGSLMGTINQAVVSLRSLVDRIDGDMLRQIASGEEHVLDAFDEVLKTALPQAQAVQIRQMQTELQDFLTETGASATPTRA